ncbi:MAG: hypothetical protein AAF430_14415 [Myxococcota bacterium]
MRIECTTRLECSPERAWQELLTPDLLRYVAAPLIRFEPVDPPSLPSTWSPGRYRVSVWLFGVLPLGRQWVGLELPDGEVPSGWPRRVRDNGSGQLAKRWDHWIEIDALPDGHTRYVDRVDVDAGLLTPVVWAFAALFYRHRQRRWRALARKLGAEEAGAA